MGLTVKNLVCHVRLTLPTEPVEARWRPLDLAVLSRMAALLGDDLDDVRVHTDAEAAARARALGADAFILGRDIYFGGGQFDSLTRRGLGLLAHELAHRRHAEEGTAEADAEREARRAERMAAMSDGRPDEPTYLEREEAAEPAAAAMEQMRAQDAENARRVGPTAPSPADIEAIVTEKVQALMRAELIVERERRGLRPSAGRLPL
jgi:hypothetical protein